MPVPGQPRNPFGQTSDRILLEAPRFDGYTGPEGDALSFFQITARGMVQAAGQVRHLWRQAVNYTPAADDYSWTENGPPSNLAGVTAARGFQLTRALRYLTQSVYVGSGVDNSRFAELHTQIASKTRQPRATLGAGQQRGKPVTRNRLTSFGSRVTPLQDRPNGGTLPPKGRPR
jgi:hypothetical protein